MRRLALLLLALVVLAGCGDDETAAPEATSGQGVKELANVLDLRAEYR